MPTDPRDPAESVDPAAVASDDDRDEGWGGREWADRAGSGEAGGDPDLERLLADRPPHHEERER